MAEDRLQRSTGGGSAQPERTALRDYGTSAPRRQVHLHEDDQEVEEQGHQVAVMLEGCGLREGDRRRVVRFNSLSPITEIGLDDSERLEAREPGIAHRRCGRRRHTGLCPCGHGREDHHENPEGHGQLEDYGEQRVHFSSGRRLVTCAEGFVWLPQVTQVVADALLQNFA